jgi:hypothetical protein
VSASRGRPPAARTRTPLSGVADSTHDRRAGLRRRVTGRASMLVALGLAGLAAGGAIVASAAVPAAPNNLVVFPDRDFVTVEGYQDRVGQSATVEVTRAGKVMGSAKGIIEEGDVAFEINHPGGYCWGAGTGVNVTPDIQAGDVVTIKFGDGTSDDTTVANAAVDSHAALDGTTLTVNGHIAAGVNPAQVEQRIVNPGLTDLVGKRDIRAVPGPMTASPKTGSAGGYSSMLQVDTATHTFKATYEFESAEAATVASESGAERFMSWQVEDADANRQGLTIAEFGELGGPGMGGCPAGPTDQAAPQGTYSVVRSSTDPTKMQVSWTPATPQPGAAAVTGYSVEAIAPANAAGESKQTGVRTGVDANRTTLTVDAAEANYTVEVRSRAGAKMSEPFAKAATTPTRTDTTAPTVTATPAPSAPDPSVPRSATEVTLTSDTGSEIYYTTDGSAAITADLPSDSAKLYGGPIAITADPTEIHWAAFDRAGNSTTGFGVYTPAKVQAPAAPTGLTGTEGQGEVTLKWADAGDASITGYQVNVYDAAGTALPASQQPPATTARTQTITGLTPGTTYQFSVTARNAGGPSPESANITLKPTAITDKVTVTSARFKTGDFRVSGRSSATSGTVTVYRVIPATATEPDKLEAIPGMVNQPLAAATAPTTGSTYDARLRTTIARPAQIVVKSSNGGQSPKFTVTNG